MSNISPDFIHNVGYLYEEMNVQQQDFLNEDSEYYDAEMSYLVEDILSTISTSMVYEGYSADGIIGFLADSSTQDILEKYLSFDENILTESVVDEDYILEQLEIFDYCIDEGWVDKLLGGALKLAGRIASKPARMRVDKILSNAKNPERARQLLQKTAIDKARAAKVGGWGPDRSAVGGSNLTGKQSAELLTKAKIGQVTQKVKDIAQKAKPILQKVGKGAGIFGLGAAGGFVGAKMAGAGKGESDSGDSQTPPKPPTANIVPPSAAPAAPSRPPSAAPAAPSRPSPAAPSRPSPAAPSRPSSAGSESQKYRDLIKQGKTKDAEKLGMQQWAKANPKLAAKVKPGQSGYEDIQKLDLPQLNKPRPEQKQDQTPTQGPANAQIDTKSIDADIKAEQERLKKKMDQKNTTSTTSESYEPYEIILEYLMDRGHADTIEEAQYVMLEMDTDAIGTIMQEYKNYVLAEEISEWVDDLIDEGYDLSEYSWDDIVEYYVTEANKAERMLGLTSRQRERARNLHQYTSKPIFYGTNPNRRKKADNSDPILNKAHKEMTTKRQELHKKRRDAMSRETLDKD